MDNDSFQAVRAVLDLLADIIESLVMLALIFTDRSEMSGYVGGLTNAYCVIVLLCLIVSICEK